jgi:hypothetical protein
MVMNVLQYTDDVLTGVQYSTVYTLEYLTEEKDDKFFTQSECK